MVTAKAVPWDTEIFGYRVGAIEMLDLSCEAGRDMGLDALDAWARTHRVRLITCRIADDRLVDSIALEDRGFRFIETVLHPFTNIDHRWENHETDIEIVPAGEEDVSCIAGWARRAFHFERYHVDPRIDMKQANERYGHWIEDAWHRQSGMLLQAKEKASGLRVGFFLVSSDAQDVDWILTAVDPDRHGQGLGRRVWTAMLDYHLRMGSRTVRTTISSRNVAVLNLYASLGFSFQPPEITMHLLFADD